MFTYRESLKTIAQDTLLVYRNFWHWNLSKVVLYVYAILATLMVSAPFFILGFWGMYRILPQVQAIPMNEPEQVLNVIFQNIPSILLIFFSGLIILTVATIFFSYIYYLLTNIYKNYLDGQKLPIFSNHFFSWKHLWKCMGVIGWASGYLLIPILIFGVLFIGIAGLSFLVGESTAGKILLGGLGFASFLGSAFLFSYYSVRILVVFPALVDTDNMEKKTKVYIDESFALTKDKFWKISGLVAPFLVTVIILSQIFYNIKENALSFVGFLISILSFVLIEGIMYMVHLSLYRILKNDR